MLNQKTAVLGSMAVQAAFVAIASRLVGAAFRVGETFHPEITGNKFLSTPEVVFRREAITTALAWGFAFGTNLLLNTIGHRRNWNASLVTFITTMTGALLAETVGRLLAYSQSRKLMAAEHPIPVQPVTTALNPKFHPRPLNHLMRPASTFMAFTAPRL